MMPEPMMLTDFTGRGLTSGRDDSGVLLVSIAKEKDVDERLELTGEPNNSAIHFDFLDAGGFDVERWPIAEHHFEARAGGAG